MTNSELKKENKNEEMPEKKDYFGKITRNYVILPKGHIVDKNNPGLIKDYYNEEYYAHPDICGKYPCGFDDKGILLSTDIKFMSYSHIDMETPKLALIYTRNSKGNLTHYEVPLNSIPMDFYKEDLYEGVFYHYDFYKDNNKKHAFYRQVKNTRKTDKLTPTLKNKYGITSQTYTITEGIKYSFGLELETSAGILPAYLDHMLSYDAVHDGSLKNDKGEVVSGEYVTGVLKGDNGFLHLRKLCKELIKRCKVNSKCGNHVHLGGITFSKEFIVYLYKLAQDIEEELFTLLPISRRNNEYCRKLRKFNIVLTPESFKTQNEYKLYIELKYNEILKYIAHVDELNPTVVNKKNNHPKGNKCGYDHSTARYCWLNLVPALFNTRGNGIYTVEIRNGSATLNYNKVKNWTLISMAIMHIADNYKTYIAKNTCTLTEIISKAYPKNKHKILAYMEERKNKFKDVGSSAKARITEQLEYDEVMSEDNDLTIKSS